MMLQNMQKQVTEEGKVEEEMYDKFMCYCQTGKGDLEASIAAGKAKIESIESESKADLEKKAMTDAALAEHTKSLDEAKEAMASATAIRTKEAATYAKFKSDSEENLAALTKAIAAVEKGVGGSFLQTSAANTVRNFAMEQATMPDAMRQELLVFLSGSQSQGYVPQSGEIIGILKQMDDEMAGDLKEATTAEDAAIQSYEALMSSKTKEVNTLQAQIEEEMTRSGELGVTVTELANELEDTKEALAEDEAFLAELETSCATKTAEWEVIKATRAEELLALAETIKVLNDDDALELFKKTLPSASASFVQISVSAASLRTRALAVLRSQRAGKREVRPQLDLIEMALSGKQKGFDVVIKMIDELVANLVKEQEADDSLKTYCDKEFDESDDKKKQLELSISDSETAIEELEGTIKTLTEEIEALEAGIKALDKAVAEATEMRKEENDEYKTLMANDASAKEVLGWAKNRLNKFYNPKLYKPPPKRVLSAEDTIVVDMGGTLSPTNPPGGIAGTGITLVQIKEHSQRKSAKAAPPPPPAAPGPFKPKGEEATGVIGMIDILVKDLDKEMQESTVSEKDAQADYEKMMADAAAKRAADSKLVTEKEAAKAEAGEALSAETDKKAATSKELMETLEYIKDLHAECDFLLKFYSVRKEARDTEIDSLGKAKAVLSGADFS
jgi:peptidoglycan hydrolase CwlO-like protein